MSVSLPEGSDHKGLLGEVIDAKCLLAALLTALRCPPSHTSCIRLYPCHQPRPSTYPLVMSKYAKLPFIVDIPIENGDIPILC